MDAYSSVRRGMGKRREYREEMQRGSQRLFLGKLGFILRHVFFKDRISFHHQLRCFLQISFGRVTPIGGKRCNELRLKYSALYQGQYLRNISSRVGDTDMERGALGK